MHNTNTYSIAWYGVVCAVRRWYSAPNNSNDFASKNARISIIPKMMFVWLHNSTEASSTYQQYTFKLCWNTVMTFFKVRPGLVFWEWMLLQKPPWSHTRHYSILYSPRNHPEAIRAIIPSYTLPETTLKPHESLFHPILSQKPPWSHTSHYSILYSPRNHPEATQVIIPFLYSPRKLGLVFWRSPTLPLRML